MASSSTSEPGVVSSPLRWVALVLHLVIGAFPFSATGLMAPNYGLVLVMALWVMGAVLVWRLGRTRPGWALLVPFAALGLWFAIMWIGDTWLDWTA